MSYIQGLINHFAALQRLAAQTGARIQLDTSNFVLEAKLRNRYFSFYPQFMAFKDGQLSHVPVLTDETMGFAGWRPYPPFSFPLATDKLLFKRHFEEADQRVPATWLDPRDADRDFIVKRSIGSFGMQISGPFRVAEREMFELGAAAQGSGEVFAEQFIEGTILKVWYWGQRAFYAHTQDYPRVAGDGRSSLSEQARLRMQVKPETWVDSPAAAVAHACFRYQQLNPDEPLAPGRAAWFDYRYGRTYDQDKLSRFHDSILAKLPGAVRTQIDAAGIVAAKALSAEMPAPVAFALDAMLDNNGALWWLEMNSNPLVPPEGYAEMFADLFGLLANGS